MMGYKPAALLEGRAWLLGGSLATCERGRGSEQRLMSLPSLLTTQLASARSRSSRRTGACSPRSSVWSSRTCSAAP